MTAPPRVRLRAAPGQDHPLPGALDDGAAARLLRAPQNDARLLVRVTVEMLLRTGLRVSEYTGPRTGAVVQIGAGPWLHVPVGKLREDRYLPLHPHLVALIDDYRRVVGWAIDSAQRADLAASALGMAIDSRSPAAGGIIHGDHGTQFTSGTFTERARKAGLLPSLGSIGDPYDNAVAESFWGRLQTELLDRQRWNTRIELANAIFEYIEGFHNRRRRHSALGWQAPIDFENATLNRAPTPQIRVQATGS